MFIAIALVTNRSKKGARTWDGKVYEKQVEKKRRRRTAADLDYHMKEYLFFKVIFQSNDGKTHEISAESDNTLYNCYRIGERVRYHGSLRSFEKYDKSKDTVIFCNACVSMNEMSSDICHRCNCPSFSYLQPHRPIALNVTTSVLT